ncbi:MAG: hypothetical protein AAF334_03350 [Pseudomonadota bacterium]
MLSQADLLPMPRRRAVTLALAAALGLSLVPQTGETGMFGSGPEITLKWEWQADREITGWRLATADKIAKTSKGLFGIGGSPSIVGNLPDSHTITGAMVPGGESFTLAVPGPEAAKLTAGRRLVIGLVADTVCVCVASLPDAVPDDQAAEWAEDNACPQT